MAKAKARTADAANFSVGIDLGTTNCAIACADIKDVETAGPIEVLSVKRGTIRRYSPSVSVGIA